MAVCCLAAPLVSAGGSIGIDYLRSDLIIDPFGNRAAGVSSDGPGVSLSLSVTERWSISIKHAEYDGEGATTLRANTRVPIDIVSETDSTSLGVSYQSDHFWLRLGASRTEDALKVVGRSRAMDFLELDEFQRAEEFVVEVGKDWMLNSWTPSLSVYLSRLRNEFRQDLRLDLLELSSQETLRENISSTSLGLSASLSHFQELSASVLFISSVGFQYQGSISGEVGGTSVLSLRNQSRTVRTSNRHSTSFSSEDEFSANIGASFVFGDWMWSAGYLRNLSSSDANDSWYVGLYYYF